MSKILRRSIIVVILIFMLWFVGVMALNPLAFNYYENTQNSAFSELRLDVFESKEAMFESMLQNYPIHYFLLKYQFWIFVVICIFFFPYTKIKRLVKKYLHTDEQES